MSVLCALAVACSTQPQPLRIAAQTAGCEACLKSAGCDSQERSCTAGCETRNTEAGIERRQCVNNCAVQAQSCRERAPKDCSVTCKPVGLPPDAK